MTGHQNMCVKGLNAGSGMFLDGTFRFHLDGEDLGGFCSLGTFSQYAVVSEWACVPIADDIAFEVASSGGLRRPDRVGSAVYAAGVRAGDRRGVFGAGGVGSNAVQGARFAGAKNVIVVDPVEFKRDMSKDVRGDRAFAGRSEAHEFVVEVTRGQLADHVISPRGGDRGDRERRRANGRQGRQGHDHGRRALERARGPRACRDLISYQRQVRGALFGDCNPLYDIPMLLGLYRSGDLKLDELISRRYRLDQINQAYQDLEEGKNIRGVIVHEIEADE